MLNIIEHGGGPGTPLIIAHGLFGSGRNWGVIAKRLSDTRPVFAVDMRNHAGSFWDADHSYDALADDLSQVIYHIGSPVDLLGHSMGGKAAMVAALQGANIRRLIVADIAPVNYNHTQQHLIDAMQALPLDQIKTRTDANDLLAQSVTEPTVRSFLLQSLNMTDKIWRLNLDVLTDQMDHILGFPKLTGAFPGPTLFLSGGQSDYVQPKHRDTIKTFFPKARFAKIPGTGHWLHAEKPREFEATARVFLDA